MYMYIALTVHTTCRAYFNGDLQLPCMHFECRGHTRCLTMQRIKDRNQSSGS